MGNLDKNFLTLNIWYPWAPLAKRFFFSFQHVGNNLITIDEAIGMPVHPLPPLAELAGDDGEGAGPEGEQLVFESDEDLQNALEQSQLQGQESSGMELESLPIMPTDDSLAIDGQLWDAPNENDIPVEPSSVNGQPSPDWEAYANEIPNSPKKFDAIEVSDSPIANKEDPKGLSRLPSSYSLQLNPDELEGHLKWLEIAKAKLAEITSKESSKNANPSGGLLSKKSLQCLFCILAYF